MTIDEFLDEYIKWIKEYPNRSVDGMKLSHGLSEDIIRYDMRVKLNDVPNDKLQELLERIKKNLWSMM